VNGRIIKKKINVRIEHVRASQTRKEWIARVHTNESVKKAHREGGRKWLG
jgi:redox-regulated HSP33 family molecular chaperone